MSEQLATLDGGEARVVANLLVDLGDLPSTPREIAEEARSRALDLGGALPDHDRGRHGPGGRERDQRVELPHDACVRIAGLLELFAGLPSTPPDVAAEASERAERVWAACNPA